MILILFCCVVTPVMSIINPDGPTVASDFTNCVRNIIDDNFERAGLLYFVNTNNMSSSVVRIRADLLKSVHEDMKHIVQIANPTSRDKPTCATRKEITNLSQGKLNRMDKFETIPLANYVVVIIDTYEDFTLAASRLLRARSWNPKAKFIIVFFHFANESTNITFIENIVTCLFKWFVINIIVIVPEAGKIRNAVIYSWLPYDPPAYCGHGNETATDRLTIVNRCERGEIQDKSEVFMNALPADMKGCILNIITLERQPFVSSNLSDPNIEMNLINEVVGRQNFSLRYDVVGNLRGEKDSGEWTGALKSLTENKGQILLGGIFPDDDIHKEFECSSTYLADSYTWVVPRALKLPLWASLVIIFNKLVWYSTLATLLLCVFTWRILGQLSGDNSYQSSLDHCFLNALVSNLGFAAYARPVKRSLQVFFVFFSLYCILFVTCYQTKLIDVLTNPSFEKQLDTVDELLQSGFKLGGFEELEDLFLNTSDDSFDSLIAERWLDVSDLSEAMIDVVAHRNFSLLCSRLELAHISSMTRELSDSFGNHRYFAFTGNVFTVPLEMVALRGFPFMDQFSHNLGMFKQMGLSEKVRDRYATLTMKRREEMIRDLENEHSRSKALSLGHLQGGFYALFLGYVSGILVLLIEIFVNSNFFAQHYGLIKVFVKGKFN